MSSDLPAWAFKDNSLTPTERLKFYGPDAARPSMILKGPSYDPRAHYLRVKALYDEYPYKTEKACDEHMISVVKLIFQKRRVPNEAIVNAIGTVVYEVLSNEGIYEPSRPYLPEKPETYTYLQRRFNEQEAFFSSYKERLEKLVTELVKFLSDYLSVLPEGAYVEDANVSTFPMLHAFNLPLRLVHTIFHTLTTAEKDGKPTFPNLSHKLYDNLIAVSGQTREKLNPDRLKFVIDYDGDPVDAVARYFAGTNLGDLCMAPIAFAIPHETRFAGHWIVAPPGRGKTTLLHTMIMEDLQKEACVILMDSKGDLINPICKLKSIKDRLVIIDPHNPIALNPLDVPKTNIRQAVSRLEYIMSALLETKITPKQAALFRSVLRALLIGFPNPTIEIFRSIVVNGPARYTAQIAKLPPDLQDFFHKEWDQYESTRNEIIWRLRLLMENDIIRTMFSAPVTKLNLSREMDAGKVIIINNSKGLLDDDGAEFFGRFFIAQVWAAAAARSLRPDTDKKPVYFYIDECQSVIRRDEKIASILDECRSQKIALILAHQRAEQIEDENVASALANCAIRYTNSDQEARSLAPLFRTTTEFLQSLPRGTFAAFVRDMTATAVALSVTPVVFTKYPQLSSQEISDLNASMAQAYGARHETVSITHPQSASESRPGSSPAASGPITPVKENERTEPSDDWR